MSRDFPDFVDPWKAAEGQRVFRGTMPLKKMTRLSPLLASSGGEARFEIYFYFDLQHNAIIKVSIEADLILLCQRSLKKYTETVKRSSLLAVIRELSEQDMLPENYEPLLHEAGKLAMLDLAEDELLLAIPQIPKDPAVDEIELSTDGEVSSPSDDNKEILQRPFAGLDGLLKKN